MVFKPFKPPLIRKSELPPETDEQDHPAKRPRLEKEEPTPNTETRLTPSLGARKPLLQVKNVSKEPVGKTAVGSEAIHLVGDERFFNVLWYVARNSVYSLRSISWVGLGANLPISLGGNRVPKRTRHGMGTGLSRIVRASSPYEMSEARIWGGQCASQNLSPERCSM